MSDLYANYSDLIFPDKKEDEKYTTIDFNGKEIKVLKYLPVIDKYNLLNTTLIQSLDDTVIINDFKLDMFFNINLAIAYADIIFSEEEQKIELSDLYDQFKTSGLLDKIINAIPEEEYNSLYLSLSEMKEEYLEERKSFSYGIANAMQQIAAKLPDEQTMTTFLEKAKNFKPEDYQNVIDFAKAANGNRDITE
jgi:hypothetical protein